MLLANTEVALVRVRFLLETFGPYEMLPGLGAKSLIVARKPFYYVTPGIFPRCAILESAYVRKMAIITGRLLDIPGDLGVITHPAKDLGALDICRLADLLTEHYGADEFPQRG